MHPSKRKGNAFEREIVATALASGIDAKRAYGSNGESLGHNQTVDVVVGGKRVQCKRRAVLPNYLLIPDGCDAVAFRCDRGDPMVMISLWEYMELIKCTTTKQG